MAQPGELFVMITWLAGKVRAPSFFIFTLSIRGTSADSWSCSHRSPRWQTNVTLTAFDNTEAGPHISVHLISTRCDVSKYKI